MKSIRLTTECGHTWTTSVNTHCTIEDLNQYWINQWFNIGSVEDKMVKVVKWEMLQEYAIINQNDSNIDNKEFKLFANDQEAIDFVKSKQSENIQFYQHVIIVEQELDRFVIELDAKIIKAIDILKRAGINQESIIYALIYKTSKDRSKKFIKFFVDKTIDNNTRPFFISYPIAILIGCKYNTYDQAVLLEGDNDYDTCLKALYNVGNVEGIADFKELAQTYRII